VNFLSKNIRYLLRQRGWSLRELASAMQQDSDWLADVLEDKRTLTIDQLMQLSELLDTSIDRLLKKELHKKPADIRMLVLDVDGVLTDGGMIFNADGVETKIYNTKDGRAIMETVKRGVEVGMLSSGYHDGLVRRRAQMLGAKNVYVGMDDKLLVLQQWIAKAGITAHQVAYIGDDINDLECIAYAGFSACPADAVFRVKQAVDAVLTTAGGKGCVREFVDDFLFLL
jgi:YrbI family 3-deoxy-D-manno-octulosonate 8-phosphate phosphatase